MIMQATAIVAGVVVLVAPVVTLGLFLAWELIARRDQALSS